MVLTDINSEDRLVQKTFADHFHFGAHEWTFTAIYADTKLVPCWKIGHRTAGPAAEFMCVN